MMFQTINDLAFFGMMSGVDYVNRGEMDQTTRELIYESSDIMLPDMVEHFERAIKDVATVNATVAQMNEAAKAELKAKRVKDGIPDPTWKDLLVLPAILAVTAVVVIVSLVL